MENNRINEIAKMVFIAAFIAIALSALRIAVVEDGNFSAYLPDFLQENRQNNYNNSRAMLLRTPERRQTAPEQTHQNNPKIKSGLSEVISIPIIPPMCFNGSSRDAILSRRRHAIKLSRIFSDMEYEPDPEVFGIVDGLPWISLEGALHFTKLSPDERITGPSRESVGILNPELLYYLSTSENEDAQSEDFIPLYKDFYFIPYKLTYNPSTNTITAYIQNDKTENGTYQPIFLSDTNAHDLGYKYAYMAESENVGFYTKYKAENNTLKSGIKELTGYYTHGNACGYEGGCNNYAPYWQYYNYIFLKKLPARFTIKLWKTKPANVEKTADINFQMIFH